jgi:hypothetical protein
MKMFSKEGVELMDVKSIQRDGDNLVVKGKLMGSMYATVCVRPEDLWAAWRLMSWRLICSLPCMLLAGLRRSRTIK